MTNQYSAKHYAAKARKWAVGTSQECPDGSAKHWAEQAAASAESVKTGLPVQTGQAGKYLMTNGTDVSWSDVVMPELVYWENADE